MANTNPHKRARRFSRGDTVEVVMQNPRNFFHGKVGKVLDEDYAKGLYTVEIPSYGKVVFARYELKPSQEKLFDA